MNKREQLLNEMIAIYIRDGSPIGSESLRLVMDMKISSATIRNYCKVLVQEGILAQPHASSGRIPTDNTLKSYWRAHIDTSNVLEIQSLEAVEIASKQCNIFCHIRLTKKDKLKEVINYKNRYSLLIFESSEAILPYNAHLHYFVSGFIDSDIEHIKNIAKSVCANALYEKLNCGTNSKVHNFCFDVLVFVKDSAFILEIAKGELCYRLKNGFYFDLFGDGYVGILQDIRLGNEYGKMFLAGELKCDYSTFYKAIA